MLYSRERLDNSNGYCCLIGMCVVDYVGGSEVVVNRSMVVSKKGS